MSELTEFRKEIKSDFSIESTLAIPLGMIIFVTSSGALEVNASRLLSNEVEKIFKKFHKKEHHDPD